MARAAADRPAPDRSLHPGKLALHVRRGHQLLQLGVDVVLGHPGGSSRAPVASSSSIAPARGLDLRGLVLGAWMAMPTSPISSEMPEKASLIRVCAWAAVYVALIVSLRVRKASTLACSRWVARVSFSSSPWSGRAASPGPHLLLERARVRASRARSSRPSASAFWPWSFSLVDWDCSWLSLQLEALAPGRYVRYPAAHLLEQLQLALVRVIQGLRGSSPSVKGLVGLRAEDQGEYVERCQPCRLRGSFPQSGLQPRPLTESIHRIAVGKPVHPRAAGSFDIQGSALTLQGQPAK